MKKLAGNEYKLVNYFGIDIIVTSDTKYLVTTDKGDVIASKQKPELALDCGWLYEWETFFNVSVMTVDLEGMHWKDTLMEV